MIVKFQNDFLEKLNSRYEYNGHTQVLVGDRFYTATILIDSTPFIVCIPLHSNCRANFIPIEAPSKSSHWKNHGLEYGKLLLLKSNELEKYASIDGVKNNVWKDIIRKKDQITSTVRQYFKDIITTLEKKEKNLYLSRSEKNNLNYSTLNCFPEYLKELRRNNINKLRFSFEVFASITEILNRVDN